MSLDYQSIRRSFDIIAHQYQDNAVLQKEVLVRLLERLADEQKIDINLKPQQILDLGCGTGWAIKPIQKLFNQAHITALDFSEKMLTEVKTLSDDKVSKVFADVHDLPFSDQQFDVVFSNMMLHWSNEQDVFSEARRVLKPGGLLLMSCLGETSLFELKQAFAQLDNDKHVHDFPALHNLGDDLLNKGFEQVVINAEVLTLTYQDITSLMKDIKASGGHNVDLSRQKGLMARQKLANLSTAYEVFRDQERLPASYEVVYLRAIKPKSGDIDLVVKK